MKAFVTGLLLILSFSVAASDFSEVEKQRFFQEMPEMLMEYYDDNAIQACIRQAKAGNDDAFSALVVIGYAKKVMDKHRERITEAVTGSKNRDEIYQRSLEIYQSEELRKNMNLLLGMPKAIKYCNSLVRGDQQ